MELSMSDLRDLLGASSPSAQPLPFKVGDKLFVRTVTYFMTGQVKEIVGAFLVMEQAAWIADTGRFSDALESCNFSEVEPFPSGTAILNTMSIIDASPIKDLPTVQK